MCEDVYWFRVPQDRVLWQTVVNTIIFGFHKRWGDYGATIRFSKRTPLHGARL
jgi:hypothetical protein